MRRALSALVLGTVLLLSACGGDALDATTSQETSAATTSSSAPRTSSTATRASSSSTYTMSPEDEAGFVATVTAQTFAENEETFSNELVKSNSLVEAQTDFHFDQPARTLVLVVTSVFDTGNPKVAYGLASDFSQLFWGANVPASIRPESLPAFSVTVDDSLYLCDGLTMAALADRELSTEMFVQRCGA